MCEMAPKDDNFQNEQVTSESDNYASLDTNSRWIKKQQQSSILGRKFKLNPLPAVLVSTHIIKVGELFKKCSPSPTVWDVAIHATSGLHLTAVLCLFLLCFIIIILRF